MTTLKTRNPEYGFYATAQSNWSLSGAEQAAAWDAAMAALIERHGAEAEDVRNFLDSQYGRHFANALTFFGRESVMAAIAAYREGKSPRSVDEARWVVKELRAMTPQIRDDFDFDARQRGFE